MVKPDKAKAVENYLIEMARYGKLGGKVRWRVDLFLLSAIKPLLHIPGKLLGYPFRNQ